MTDSARGTWDGAKAACAALPRRIRYRTVTFASTRPGLYYGLRRLSGMLDPGCVGRETELVIEGVPRSANGTTVHGFLERQPRPVAVAHHKHHAAQLLRAAAWDLPAVVLIREPVEAAVSTLALMEEAYLRDGRWTYGAGLTFGDVLHGYVTFYRAVEPVLDRIVIAPFEEVTRDIDETIARVNARFGTAFATDRPANEAREALNWHATPNPLRQRLKRTLGEGYERAAAASGRLRALAAEADALHRRYLEAARGQRAGAAATRS